ncbi:conserved Plasmodium protein, unknown function [Plasmodium sp. gorilla clade G2]|uniref:conserved Plasmodium protein, unknown function n=1 Tax=Plasmodium sp. gorilla clade G2 TaxID=880535 RepID=UPI000D2212AB|nr:conserved Plasmodium protein, unknown function [Plasmodium sp. gorilla clade G2]SOV11968.1 conserved Plasmodium protein, unknown function [Plasmodium sp. gorilla clade G2]
MPKNNEDIDYELNLIEKKINIYHVDYVTFEECLRTNSSKGFDYNFDNFVHLVCKIKNVRKHGKALFFCDTISQDLNKEKENKFFYGNQILKSDDNIYLIRNIFDENIANVEHNIQLVISKNFYINEDIFKLYEEYLLKNEKSKVYDKNNPYDNKMYFNISKETISYSMNMYKRFHNYLNQNENDLLQDEEKKKKICLDSEHIPMILINEYVQYEILNKIIKPDSLVYIIGLPVLTDTNEKSLIVFSSYLLRVNYEYFNINEVFKLFEQKYFSMGTLCRSLRVNEHYIHRIYNNEIEKKKRFLLNIVYRNKDYESISNQKMNNFEIFIIKIIDIIPKCFKIYASDFTLHMKEEKNVLFNNLNMKCIFNQDLFAENYVNHDVIEWKEEEEDDNERDYKSDDKSDDKSGDKSDVVVKNINTTEQNKGGKNMKKKQNKKKKKKKDMLSYMNNKKVPQIYWMLNHINNMFNEIKNIDTNDDKEKYKFSCEYIISSINILINKYIECNTTLYENYLEFLDLFIEQNAGYVSKVNREKVKIYIEKYKENRTNSFENSYWKDIEFYNIDDLYLNDSKDVELEENKNVIYINGKEKNEVTNSTNYYVKHNNNNLDEKKDDYISYNNIIDDTFNNNDNISSKDIIYNDHNILDHINNTIAPKKKITTTINNNSNINCNSKNMNSSNVTYDYCILDVGGGKGDLGIYISLAFPNVLVIILDININSLFSCFVKLYCNKIKNVLIINESILNFDFKKYKINMVVGLHCCGGLTDYTIKKCMDERIPFLICSCCYTKYKDLRKHIFDFKNDIIINEMNNYIYNKDNYHYMNYISSSIFTESNICNINKSNDKTCHNENLNNMVNLKKIDCLYEQEYDGDDNLIQNGHAIKNYDNNKSHENDKNDIISIYCDKDEYNINSEHIKNNCGVISNETKKYDKYEKKILRRTIPNIYSFMNLLSKLCESENVAISYKCMHFYNNLRFKILQALFNKSKKGDENDKTVNVYAKEGINLSLHSFPVSYSPKNIVLKGYFI